MLYPTETDLIHKAIGSNLRKYRLERSMSMRQFAELIGITESFYGLVERGERGLAQRNINMAVNMLGISLNDLYDDYLMKEEQNEKDLTIQSHLNIMNDDEKDIVIAYLDSLNRYRNILIRNILTSDLEQSKE